MLKLSYGSHKMKLMFFLLTIKATENSGSNSTEPNSNKTDQGGAPCEEERNGVYPCSSTVSYATFLRILIVLM